MSQTIHRIDDNGREIILIGTAHVSQKSADEVKETIAVERPNAVCVELCQARFDAVANPDAWKNMDIAKVIREKKTSLLLANLFLSSFQRRMADKMHVKPGQEMIQAIDSAKEIGAAIVLADRSIQTTLRRAWGRLSFWSRSKLMSQLLASIFVSEDISEEQIEKLKEEDMLSAAINEIAKAFPALKEVLIDERDLYLAAKIKAAPGMKVVAVVGAGHVPGIKQHFNDQINTDNLDLLPPPGPVGKIMSWSIPALIVLMIGASFFMDANVGWEQLKSWILWTSIPAALGTIIAFGHPLSIITALLTAPFTAIHPLLAVGWLAGLVEAIVRKPTVADIENLPNDTKSAAGFWRNRTTRILLVVFFANLGCSIGVWIAGLDIIKSFLHLGT